MRLALCLLAVLAPACAHQARLYRLDSTDMLLATFKDTGSGAGPVWVGADRKTSPCQGEYSTASAGSTTWGAIYAGGDVATGALRTEGDSAKGAAVIRCQDGRVIECEYVTDAMAAKGTGACRDNAGHRYRLMF
jgi:hypothetical protein